MIKILIIDDEAHCRNVLIKHLAEFTDYSVKCETASDVSEGIVKINSFHPEIVLLDIRMNEGTGFDLMDRIDSKNLNIIFTTAYNEYAIKAFKYKAVHYLLKPIDKHELFEALNRCSKTPQILDNNKAHELKKLFISTETLELRSNPEDICFIKAEGSYSKIHLKNDRSIVTSKNIGDYDRHLPLYFFRVHKSYLINLKHIKEVHSSDNNIVTNCNRTIPISRRKKKEFFKRLND